MDLEYAIGLLIGGVGLLLGGAGLGARALFARMHALEAKAAEDDRRVRDDRTQLLARVKSLEEQVTQIPLLEKRVTTLLDEMAALQERVETLQADLDHERDEKTRAVKQVGELTAKLEESERARHDLEVRNAALLDAMAVVRGGAGASAETGEAREARAEVPEAAGED